MVILGPGSWPREEIKYQRRGLSPTSTDVGTAPLAPELTLKAAGVRDGHTLSITKKNGGGG